MRTIENKTVSVIIPTYDEKENVSKMCNSLKEVFNSLKVNYEIIFVDDNSPDGTIEEVRKIRENDNKVKYILMSRRWGAQDCLMAGLNCACGDVIITLDADFAHPPEYIYQMINKWEEDYDIVIMKRRESDRSAIRKIIDILFYKFLSAISDSPIYNRFSGFALMDKKVVASLRTYKESEPFIRGLIGLVGFDKTELYYKEGKRTAGISKYSIFDMFKLAISGITSFSVKPLYIIFNIGLMTVGVVIIYFLILLYIKTSMTPNVFSRLAPGFIDLSLVIILLSGIQIISIGILAIYISKIFKETKKRPNYIIEESRGIEIEDSKSFTSNSN